ncbi:hypothetical protein N0B44_26470 [Roseibacterium beibuensis]|uniref:hypothetical protein n=1 Tax=[Roseibacterium] beibuensis TaxID=1193142 RepID=UPI00217E389B|nr:hypothetical protein [Roseibacterium beibuensis]MCS6626472.1 hypothetical protein [Roseibacterium beibuensis]
MAWRGAVLAGLTLALAGCFAAPIQPTPKVERAIPSWDPLARDGEWAEQGLLPHTLRVRGDRVEIDGPCDVFRGRRSGPARFEWVEGASGAHRNTIVYPIVEATIEPKASHPSCRSRSINIGQLEAHVVGLRIDGRPMVQVVLDDGGPRSTQPEGADLRWRGWTVLLPGDAE